MGARREWGKGPPRWQKTVCVWCHPLHSSQFFRKVTKITRYWCPIIAAGLNASAEKEGQEFAEVIGQTMDSKKLWYCLNQFWVRVSPLGNIWVYVGTFRHVIALVKLWAFSEQDFYQSCFCRLNAVNAVLLHTADSGKYLLTDWMTSRMNEWVEERAMNSSLWTWISRPCMDRQTRNKAIWKGLISAFSIHRKDNVCWRGKALVFPFWNPRKICLKHVFKWAAYRCFQSCCSPREGLRANQRRRYLVRRNTPQLLCMLQWENANQLISAFEDNFR